MKTVNEVSKLTGVSVRTLHYYDTIGLLPPTSTTEAGYRLYDDTALERLQQIMLFRELEFPLKEIKQILDSPNFDRNKALEQQIELLRLKKEQLENLITFAREIKWIGVKNMDFSVFDKKKMEEYVAEAKKTWGDTIAYKQYEEKTDKLSDVQKQGVNAAMMQLFAEFGQMLEKEVTCDDVQKQVKKLQDFITEHFYTCTKEILSGLGKMYLADERMKENIDKAGGMGTADFVSKAISIYCNSIS